MSGGRWRLTFGELQHLTKATANDLDRWADLGALGKDVRERGKSHRWRHLNRTMAQRAVLMSRLLAAGMNEGEAAVIASKHHLKEDSMLCINLTEHVTIGIRRRDLP